MRAVQPLKLKEGRRLVMNRLWQWLLNPPINAPRATILIRLSAGGVFLTEGIMKFIYPSLGVKRFTLLGFPAPDVMSAFSGTLEIVGGILIITGFLTRFITIPFIIEMVVATLSTKVSMYYGTSPLPPPPIPPAVGFWGVIHDVRSEYAQQMADIFLLIVGPGKWSVDAYLTRKRQAREGKRPVREAAPDAARIPSAVRI